MTHRLLLIVTAAAAISESLSVPYVARPSRVTPKPVPTQSSASEVKKDTIAVSQQSNSSPLSAYCASDQVMEWQFTDFTPVNYDRLKQPNRVFEGPVKVGIGLKVAQLIAVTEAEQSFTLDVLILTKWHDKRLNYPPNCNVSHALDISWKDKLWVPDVYFVNGLSPSVIKITPLFFEVDALTSHIILVTRQVVKLRCHMDLFRFPQDSQDCNIDIALLSVKSERAYLHLESVTMSEGRLFQNFYLKLHDNTSTCVPMRGSSFSCVRARFTFYRNISYYLIRHYGPSFLLVVTAFIGFWIPPVGYPARVAIVVTPLLSLITKQTQISHEVNVSYVVALHLWMILNIFFVFMCLVEYALAIAYCHAVNDKSITGNENESNAMKRHLTHHLSAALIWIYGNVDYEKNPLDRNKVDYASRIIFPIVYMVFVLVYFFIFLVPWIIKFAHTL